MHELSLCQAIVTNVGNHAPAGERVSRVTVRIGHLRQVVPDSLLFSWEVLTDGTDLAGSELHIEQVPAVVHCSACDADTTLALPMPACGTCSTTDVELVTGNEFLLVSIDVATEVV